MRYDKFICVTCIFIFMTWLNHTCDTTHSLCNMTHSHVWRHTHIYVRHDTFICVTWLIRHVCGVTHSYARLDSCSIGNCACRETRFVHMCDMTRSHVWYDTFICVTWLMHMCDVTRLHVWHDSSICETRLMLYGELLMMRDMTHSYVWHDSFICVIWLIHMCDMTHSYV